MNYRNIAVLYGGLSNEREVSLAGGKAVAGGLRRAGFQVTEIDVDRDLPERLREARVEAAYIVLHGRFGEDGTVQGLLELMRIPYTGSSVAASAITIDKHLTRQILAGAGLPVAEGVVLHEPSLTLPPGWTVPVVVKPVNEGSSVGVSVVRNADQVAGALSTAFGCSRRVLVERYVPGIEVQVAVLDGEVLGAIEIEPKREFYDYKAKYEAGGAVHHIPPRIPEDRAEQCRELGLTAYCAVGCAGLARIDLILPNTGDPIILEVNTSPGMTELSLAPEIAAHAGIPFDDLVVRVMNAATLHIV